MDLFQAAILGIIEGLTEFLPVSSTGHLILAGSILQIPSSAFLKTFDIVIQLGAILAVIYLYLPKVIDNKKLWKPILYAFIPTGVLGFVAYPFIKTYLFDDPWITVASLFLGGLILLVLDRKFKSKLATHSAENLPLARLITIGIFQSFSFIPGVSRSAASIIGGLAVGLTRAEAVEFSFLLAVPTMIAASSYDLVRSQLIFSTNDFFFLFVGFLFSFFTALIAIRTFISFISKNNFTPFALYRIVLATIFFLLF